MKAVWVFEKIVNDGELYEIDGISIWDNKWEETSETIKVKDPLYGKFFSFEVYKIKNDTVEIIFAAGEFSNNVWGIYRRENSC